MIYTISRADNGWIVQVAKRDVLTGQQEQTVNVFNSFEDVINFLQGKTNTPKVVKV